MTAPTHQVKLGRFIAVVAGIAIAIATLTPTHGTPPPDPLCIWCGELAGVDIVLNLLLFIPIGVGLGLKGDRPLRAIIALAVTSIAIELIQFLIPGRDPSLRDVLMNTAGGSLGVVVGAHGFRFLRPSVKAARCLLAGWAAMWLALQCIAAYSYVPAPTTSRYYGQIARDLGEMLEGFHGKVTNPTIGSLPISDSELPDRQVRNLLSRRDGAMIHATVVPETCPTRTAGIVRIADEQRNEILFVGQRGADLIFGIRTGADAVRLRPVYFRLRNVFGTRTCLQRPDTIVLAARYTLRVVSVAAFRKAAPRSPQVAPDGSLILLATPSTSESWQLFLPIQTYREGGTWQRVVSVAWLFGLSFPLGYWAAYAIATTGTKENLIVLRRHMMMIVAPASVLLIGLSVLPAVVGLSPARPWEWACTVAGTASAIGFVLRWKVVSPSRFLT